MERFHTPTAIVSPHPCFLRGYNIHLFGRGPIDIQRLRSVSTTDRSKQHPSVHPHECLAWHVSNLFKLSAGGLATLG